MMTSPQAALQSQNLTAARERRKTSMNPRAVNMSAYMRSNSLRSYRSCRRCSNDAYSACQTAATATHKNHGHAKLPIARSRSMNVVADQLR